MKLVLEFETTEELNKQIIELYNQNVNSTRVGFDNKLKDFIKLRDDNKCVLCQSENNLEVHHIFNNKNYELLRVEESNLVTLCSIHHKAIHTLFGNDVTLKEFELFIGKPYEYNKLLLKKLEYHNIDYINNISNDYTLIEEWLDYDYTNNYDYTIEIEEFLSHYNDFIAWCDSNYYNEPDFPTFYSYGAKHNLINDTTIVIPDKLSLIERVRIRDENTCYACNGYYTECNEVLSLFRLNNSIDFPLLKNNILNVSLICKNCRKDITKNFGKNTTMYDFEKCFDKNLDYYRKKHLNQLASQYNYNLQYIDYVFDIPEVDINTTFYSGIELYKGSRNLLFVNTEYSIEQQEGDSLSKRLRKENNLRNKRREKFIKKYDLREINYDKNWLYPYIWNIMPYSIKNKYRNLYYNSTKKPEDGFKLLHEVDDHARLFTLNNKLVYTTQPYDLTLAQYMQLEQLCKDFGLFIDISYIDGWHNPGYAPLIVISEIEIKLAK